MRQPTSMRLSEVTTRQLKDLAVVYGNQTTALTVAIDRLWRDVHMGQNMGEYHLERFAADGLGDLDGFTEEEIETILRLRTKAAEAAIAAAGWTLVWDEIPTWTTGHAFPAEGAPNEKVDNVLEELAAEAVEQVTDEWIAGGYPID